MKSDQIINKFRLIRYCNIVKIYRETDTLFFKKLLTAEDPQIHTCSSIQKENKLVQIYIIHT